MSIADAIVNAQNKIKAAYDKCKEKGAILPNEKNLANLPSTIDTIQGGGDVVPVYVPYGMTPVQEDKVLLNPVGGYALGDFTMEGSTDNKTWVTLGSFNNRTSTANSKLTFDLSDNQMAYQYYRLNITSDSSGSSGRVSVGMLTLTASVLATNGIISVSKGWTLSDDGQTAFYINQNTVKTFEELTDGMDKAPQMGLWLTKTTDGVTDFKLYAAAPTGFAGVKKLADVTLSDDLSMIAEVTNV